MRFSNKIKPIALILFVFFFTNLIFLTNFPFVHSDESWLSGLSRNMLQEKSLSVTETFFDLYPRYPHAIKSLFHAIQIIFIQGIGYHIFTFRLISLLAGTATLYLFFRLAEYFTNNKMLAYLATLMLGMDIQFIYASHFARQEIILVFILLLALYYFLTRYRYKKTIWQDLIMGLILGSGIGIHPNSFVVALPFVIIYTYHLFIDKKIKLAKYLTFGGTLGVIALLFVLLSVIFDPHFIQNYSSYGETLGVTHSLMDKIDMLDYFYKKLFYQVSGTYYTPPIQFQFIIFPIAILFTTIRLLYKRDKKILPLLFVLLGINLGYVLIGRYNQTSIIFIFPACYLLISNGISLLQKKYSYIMIVLIIAVLGFNTISTIIKDSHYNYDDYLTEIATVVDQNDRVLANLNAEYFFANGTLFDYRNLAHLKENNMTFAEYITANRIEYIIYPEEMDFIYNSRPVWNILYGNIYPYYQEMQNFLDQQCSLVHSFTNETYGIRLARYIGGKDWSIQIYKVNDVPLLD